MRTVPRKNSALLPVPGAGDVAADDASPEPFGNGRGAKGRGRGRGKGDVALGRGVNTSPAAPVPKAKTAEQEAKTVSRLSMDDMLYLHFYSHKLFPPSFCDRYFKAMSQASTLILELKGSLAYRYSISQRFKQ